MSDTIRCHALPTRRFGRTELPMPILSLGGMRFQQSWTDLAADAITDASQQQLEATLRRAVACGFHHVETARHYGSSVRPKRRVGRAWHPTVSLMRLGAVDASGAPAREAPSAAASWHRGGP